MVLTTLTELYQLLDKMMHKKLEIYRLEMLQGYLIDGGSALVCPLTTSSHKGAKLRCLGL